MNEEAIKINMSDQVKYVVVIQDSELSWEPYIEFKVQKARMTFCSAGKPLAKLDA